jgi:glycosyltransferase involved in cell wall biosynthesis
VTSFTLLLPVYGGNAPEQLREAFESSVQGQTRPPDAVVVTVDGAVPDAIERTLLDLSTSAGVPVDLVRLPERRGLAAALNAGLKEVKTEYVARMDADDVSRPDRFERQMAELDSRDLDLLGAGLAEFVGTVEFVVATRTPPVGEAIRRRARWAQPFYHPTVIYRRSTVLQAGGYPTDAGRIEDYVLFARMLVAGARADNVPEPLLYYRVDDGAYDRRGGLRMFRDELRLQRELFRTGLTSPGQYARNVVLRGAYRLTPTRLRMHAYRAAATQRADRSAYPGRS